MAIIEGRPATDFSDMNRKYIHDVAEEVASGSGGGGLPDITAADEGKVLTAENGEAAWANSKIMVVWQAADESGSVFTLDKTWQEIHDAAANGIMPVIFYKYPDQNNLSITYITSVTYESGTYYVSVGDHSFTCSAATDYPSLED